MQAWRSRLLPTYPPLNRSNSQTQPWPILIQAPRLPGDSVRRRGRGLAGGAVHQRKPQRWLQSPTSRCWPTLGALRRRAALAPERIPLSSVSGVETLGSKLFPKCPPPAISGRPLRRDKKGFPHDPLSHYPFLAARATKSVKSAARRGEAKCTATQAPGQAQEDRDKDARS